VIVNKAAYDKLPEVARKDLEKTAADALGALLSQEVREFETKLSAMHKSQGGSVVELSPEQREAWRKDMTVALPKMVEAIGGKSNAFWKVLQEGIKVCSK
jgi:TRAP-type C4-dicarboxylate transport system substrate-binding protein